MHNVIDARVLVAALPKKMQCRFDDLADGWRAFFAFAKPRDWLVSGGGMATALFFVRAPSLITRGVVDCLLAVFPRRTICFLRRMRRPWRGPDFDSRTNIIVTKAKLQGLAIMGSGSQEASSVQDGAARRNLHLTGKATQQAVRGSCARPSRVFPV